MVSEFERRLAEVLGTRMPAPLAGQVFVSPGPAPAAGLSLVLGVTAMRPFDPEFHTRRMEAVPGSPDPRRVVRLECDVSIEARPAANQGRAEQMQALDLALFALAADDLRSGAALTDSTDRGFLIQEMKLTGGVAPLAPQAPQAPPTALTFVARGLFWPVGQPGQAGIRIGEIRVRGARLPIDVAASSEVLTAGGPAVDFTIHVGALPALTLRAGGATPMPFGALAVAVIQPDGRPGNGTLSGGDAGLGPVRIVTLSNDEATVTYTPPAQPGLEELVVALDDHEGGPGIEIGRLPLRVRSA